MSAVTVRHTDNQLMVRWPDGHESAYCSIWLLDNAPEHRDPGNAQRLVDIADLPENPVIIQAKLQDGWLEVTWALADRRTRFSMQWLREHCCCPKHNDTDVMEPLLWPIADEVELDYQEVCESKVAREKWLQAVATWGIAFLRNVPCDEDRILEVAALAGWVRQTNYGQVFDVKVVPNPGNLADTNLALGLHTDNPYREPVPGLQMLHCLKAAPDGESIFADGFAVAEAMRAEDVSTFHLLATRCVRFTFADAHTELSGVRPLIKLGGDGKMAAIHYNSRSMAPVLLGHHEIAEFYRAYRQLALRLRERRFQLRRRLEEGHLVLFDNLRILHGRAAFHGEAPRHLRGCYLDRDGLFSNLAVLRRERRNGLPGTDF